MSKLEEFLAGERLDDVALFLTHDHLDDEGKLANYGEDVADGVVLVVPGDDGRRMFASGTGMDAMSFAKGAMGTEGTIDPDLGGGDCPAADEENGGEENDGEGGDDGGDDEHRTKFVFAFAEAENPEVGGLYAEGDVIHAYAQCECGESYSQKWVVGER